MPLSGVKQYLPETEDGRRRGAGHRSRHRNLEWCCGEVLQVVLVVHQMELRDDQVNAGSAESDQPVVSVVEPQLGCVPKP